MRIWHLGAAVLIAAVGFGLARRLGIWLSLHLVLGVWIWSFLARIAIPDVWRAFAPHRRAGGWAGYAVSLAMWAVLVIVSLATLVVAIGLAAAVMLVAATLAGRG